MNRQAWIAWLLILLQAVMFWYLSETVLFPIVVLVGSLPAVLWRHRWNLTSGYLPWIDALLATGCALRWQLAPYEPRTVAGFVQYPLVHAAGQFFLLVQVARLWARRSDHPLPVYLPLLAVLVFICLGDIDVSRTQRRMYQHATLALVGLTCLYYSAARRQQVMSTPRRTGAYAAITLAVLFVMAVCARTANAWILESWSELERWITHSIKPQPRVETHDALIGFSGQAPLGAVQLLRSTLSDEVALRIYSDRPPQYLRGAVFERFLGNRWDLHGDWLPLNYQRRPPGFDPDAPRRTGPVEHKLWRFAIRPKTSDVMPSMQIWRTASVDRFSFLPLSTVQVEVPAEFLYVDRHGIVAAVNIPVEERMTVWYSEQGEANRLESIVQPAKWDGDQPMELSRSEIVAAKVRLRQLPDRIDSGVLELATRLFANCRTPADRVEAVRNYFASYTYSDRIELPPLRHPLTHFLLHKPAAHCEFFATGAAVLLRLGSIPCRYVTGYVGGEYNPLGGYWVVRQRQAHAWLEVFLPDQGWVTFDPTPAAGIPQTVRSLSLWQLWDEISLRSQMIRTEMAHSGWASKFTALKLFLGLLVRTVPGWGLSLGLLYLTWRIWRSRDKSSGVSLSRSEFLRLHGLLEQLDRRLRRLGLERGPAETLHTFAQRLEESARRRPNLRAAAVWYQHYAEVRYDATLEPTVHDALCAEWAIAWQKLRERSRPGTLATDTDGGSATG
jgi:transglutaminase-like putative cysteine protease